MVAMQILSDRNEKRNSCFMVAQNRSMLMEISLVLSYPICVIIINYHTTMDLVGDELQ